MGLFDTMYQKVGKLYVLYKINSWANSVYDATKSAWNFTGDKVSEQWNKAKYWFQKKYYYWKEYDKWVQIRVKEERVKINLQQNNIIDAHIDYKQVERETKRKLEELKLTAKRDKIYQYLEPDFKQIDNVLDNFNVKKMAAYILLSKENLVDTYQEILNEVNALTTSSTNNSLRIDNEVYYDAIDDTEDNEVYYDAVEELEYD